MVKGILFLTLKIFSATGGIEKMNRVAGKALHETGEEVKIFSSHDENPIENNYFPCKNFLTFHGNRKKFAVKSIQEGIKNKVVILSHINLLTVGYLIKLFSPKTKLVLFAHGIEIWKPLSFLKKKMLLQCDQIWAVSNFTNDTIKELGYVNNGNSIVLNNCLDPYLQKENNPVKSEKLLSRYGLRNGDFILLTLTRLNSDEKYKGYDKVLGCLQVLIKEYPHLRYLIMGKYDKEEKGRMDKMINTMNLNDAVVFTGYIAEEELSAHYNLADLYIMPSLGEGFGIVFIEALYNGIPVIAGNKDGSIDALLNGKLGLLVDPGDLREITSAIKKVINNKSAFAPDEKLLMQNFSYEVYKEKIKKALNNLMN
jgi:glycosyltransferase involved in cell wall biosynthesis